MGTEGVFIDNGYSVILFTKKEVLKNSYETFSLFSSVFSTDSPV